MFALIKTFEPVSLPDTGAVCPIEQFPAKDFFENDCGWTRNDIAQLSAATTKAQYDAIVQRLVENKAQYNLKGDEKLADAYEKVMPRYCQSPMELMDFAEVAAGRTLDDVAYQSVREKSFGEVVDNPVVQVPEKSSD